MAAKKKGARKSARKRPAAKGAAVAEKGQGVTRPSVRSRYGGFQAARPRG